SGSCAPATMPNDVSLLEYIGPNRTCPETPTPLSVKVMNHGTVPLTAFTLTASTLFGTELITYNWTGNLDTYEMEVVELGDAIFPSTSMFFIDVTSADDYDGNNSVTETMNLTSEIATSLVRVRFTTDNMPGDNRWDITDGAGDVVASTDFGDMTENQTEYEWWVNLDATGCYKFTVYDQLGNGGNIECDIATFNEAGENINTIFTVNNNGNWRALNKGFLVNEVNMHVGEQAATPIAVYPNPTSGMLTLRGLSTQSAQRVEIHDAQGKLILDQQRPATGATWVLDLNELNCGLYILTVIDGTRRFTQSIVRS
ncbi:MAG: T9SS type A sorting domain-containing protein, partial [Flavobacteriales bacterium]